MLPRASLPPHMGRKRQRRSEPQIADMPSHVIGRARSAFIGVGAFSLIINLLMLTPPLYMMQIFDRVLSGQSRQTLLYLSHHGSGHAGNSRPYPFTDTQPYRQLG